MQQVEAFEAFCKEASSLELVEQKKQEIAFALKGKEFQGLGKFVKDLARKNGANPTSTFLEVLEKGIPSILEADDFAYGSAIEALDQIENAPKEYFSTIGHQRLLKLSKDLDSLRRRANGSITETLIEAERYLFLDSEVIVNNHNAMGRRHLDQFLDEAARFQRNGGTLFSFLEWLKIADSEEGGIKFSNVSVSNVRFSGSFRNMYTLPSD